MQQWFYSDSGQQRGPVSEAEIKNLLVTNRISGATLVWADGMADWMPAGKIPAFEISPYASPYAPPLSVDPEHITDLSGYIPSGPQIRPWVRYWARTFDFIAACVIMGLILGIIAPQALETANDTVLGLLMLLIYNFVEPVMLSVFGTTPFRLLLGVRLRNKNGTKLSFLQALRRSFSVWVRGQGLGVPLVTIVTGLTSYSRLTNNRITSWDERGGYTVSHQEIAWWRWLIMIVALIGFVALIVM